MSETYVIHGVFEWNSGNHYPGHAALRTYSSRTRAQLWADEQNRIDGWNRVVRTVIERHSTPMDSYSQ